MSVFVTDGVKMGFQAISRLFACLDTLPPFSGLSVKLLVARTAARRGQGSPETGEEREPRSDPSRVTAFLGAF